MGYTDKLAIGVSAIALLVGATTAQGAQTGVSWAVLPPPLSFKAHQAFKQNPGAFKQLMERLSKDRTQKKAQAPSSFFQRGWQQLTNDAPGAGLSNPLLLTDGSVIVHVGVTPTWYKLTPDINSNYVNGTWSQIASLPSDYGPLYFASQIMKDGKVLIEGGEYNNSNYPVWTNKGALYDPVANTWTSVSPPSSFNSTGDAQSVMLSNGTFMLAESLTSNEALLSYPAMTWTQTGSGKYDINDEEGWTLLRNGKVLTADSMIYKNCSPETAELYDPSTGTWSLTGYPQAPLSDCSGNSTGQGHPSYEIGPLILRPDNTVVGFSGVQTGDPAGTTIYDAAAGTWSVGPHVPYIDGANYNLGDAPATIMPNGRILFAASPGYFGSPTHYFEFNPDNTITLVGDAPNAGNDSSYLVNMLMLPTGQILEVDQSNTAAVYTPTAAQELASTAPSVTSGLPQTLNAGATYDNIVGVRLNGITNGGYGDDQQAGTNFPIVGIMNHTTKHVFYARTFNFSNRGIDPNNTSSFSFTVNPNTEAGRSTLFVVANGSRTPYAVTINSTPTKTSAAK